MLDLKRVLASRSKKPEDVKLKPLATLWGEVVVEGDVCGHEAMAAESALCKADNEAPSAKLPCFEEEYCLSGTTHPHPQFARTQFQLLDGWWEYCIVSANAAHTAEPSPEAVGVNPQNHAAEAWRTAPIPATWEGLIRVPFSPEAPLSGVERQLKPDELLWYKRTFLCPSEQTGASKRCILHFEAVDHACACYCNGVLVGTHEGGYLPFSFDITEALLPDENELTLCVHDPSDEGVQLRGKQRLARGGIWYTAQSGIWQSVWLELVPENHITSLKIDADADTGHVSLAVTVSKGSETLTHSLALEVPNPHLWSPDDPYLYQLELIYESDTVYSYCAFRTVTMEEDAQGIQRVCINHKPYFLRGVLDQGYWSDGLMTAPSDEALVYDIQTMKDLGFTMLRKHIKIESDRWYYHCDRLGMLVWQDMVSGGSAPSTLFSSYLPTLLKWSWGHYGDGPRHYKNLASASEAFREEWTQTCIDTIAYLGNHPSIITWVLFNEAWGQFDAQKATALVRKLDPSRPIDAVSGWYDQACGDFLSVHNYFRPLEVYKDHGKDRAAHKRAFVISEFGGLTYHVAGHSSLDTAYGYGTYTSAEQFRAALKELFARADALEQQGLAGFVYTQLSDVEEETNGLLTYDRRINKLSDSAGES